MYDDYSPFEFRVRPTFNTFTSSFLAVSFAEKNAKATTRIGCALVRKSKKAKVEAD